MTKRRKSGQIRRVSNETQAAKIKSAAEAQGRPVTPKEQGMIDILLGRTAGASS